MRKITTFIFALLCVASITRAQSGVRIFGAQQFQLDDNVVGDAKSYISSLNGSLGIDNTGNVVPGTFPSACAVLDLSSTNKGLLLPRLTNAQMLGICGGAPPAGLMLYNTSTNSIYFYNGAAWTPTAGAAWLISGNAGTVAASNFLGTIDNVAVNFRVNNSQTLGLNTNGSIQRDNGGNARGVNSVDLQIQRNAATQVASGSNSFIGGGLFNTASGIQSFVGGGQSDQATNNNATVVGGVGNIASAPGSFVGGGGFDGGSVFGNQASGKASALVGGMNGSANGDYSFVGGGFTNNAGGNSAVVVGGTNNVSSALASTVGGGASNTASTNYGTVGGGQNNLASGFSHATVGGGVNNQATAFAATVAGGNTNTATNNEAFVGGGTSVNATGFRAVATGGAGNTSSNSESTVSGGESNNASGDHSTVGGGFQNTAGSVRSTVGGGGTNTASTGSDATVAGGWHNRALGAEAAVAGGADNTASGFGSFVGGGTGISPTNNTASGSNSAILGGFTNTASGDYSAIAGGRQAVAFNYGQFAFSSGVFATAGDAQTSVYVVSNATSNNVATDLFTNGTGSSTRITLANNSSYAFHGVIVARQTGGANSDAWEIRGVIHNNAGVVTVDASNITHLGATGWTITVNNTGSSLNVNVTGAAATNIRWVGRIETAEVSF
ncbi:MAG TPA: hypothetical protein VEW28_07610 [Candidatus Kapabacteria bacterium]|nr:hypothetical protein [Candidatus Kapabacteria bacterium]